MVKITTRTPTRNVTSVKSTKNVEPVEAPVADKNVAEPEAPFIERRKRPDRRRGAQGRGPYEMRSGTDRRKNNRGKPTIDTDV